MHRKRLAHLFRLENHQEDLNLALTPKSCGGGDEFKLLALYGDSIIDLALISNFSSQGIANTGIITPVKNNFHHQNTLLALGKFLGLDQVMIPTDPTQVLQPRDIKEGVEALLGATYRVHGLKICSEVVLELFEQSKLIPSESGNGPKTILSENVIGDLQEKLALQGVEPPGYEDIPSGTKKDPRWISQISINFHGEEISLKSDNFPNTKDAKRDVAQKALLRLGMRKTNQENPFILKQEKKMQKSATQSIQQREITFIKGLRGGAFKTGPMHLSTETGESLYQWAKKKVRKNPYGCLLHLSARMEEINGASWSASLEDQELILLHVEISGVSYFEIGEGVSKSKARRQAAKKILESSDFLAWIGEFHSDRLL